MTKQSFWIEGGRSPTRAIYDRVMHCRGRVFEDQDAMYVIVCLRKIELQCPFCKERCRLAENEAKPAQQG